MDCRRATEIMSGVVDGERLPAAEAVRAQQHCAGCAECSAMLATMRRMGEVQPAKAPAALVERILAATQTEADAPPDAMAALEHGVPVPDAAARPAPAARRVLRSSPSWWQPRFTAYATAAVVVLVVSAASTYTLVQMTKSMSDTPTEDSMQAMSTETWTTEDSAGAADASTALTAESDAAARSGVPAPAPSYVAWDGSVWVRADAPPPSPSELATAGTTISDLGEPDGPRDRVVLTTASDRAAIFVQASDGSLMRFMRVVRTLGMREYALSAGGSIATFGTWPALPPGFATPTAEDGSPAFSRQGFEDRSLDIYVPIGADSTSGFALAPGTPSGDPAAGNPFWTWWAPVD